MIGFVQAYWILTDSTICQRCLETVARATPLWAEVNTIIPKGEYHR